MTCYAITLRGLNFADGPFRNILRISGMGLDQFFFENFAERLEVEIRKIGTNYKTPMIFTLAKLAKAYVLYRIKAV